MNLDQVYTTRVNNHPVASNLGLFTNFERDPLFTNLENNVLSKLNEVDVVENKNEITSNLSNQVLSFGFEDAIKELINIKNNGSAVSR